MSQPPRNGFLPSGRHRKNEKSLSPLVALRLLRLIAWSLELGAWCLVFGAWCLSRRLVLVVRLGWRDFGDGLAQVFKEKRFAQDEIHSGQLIARRLEDLGVGRDHHHR